MRKLSKNPLFCGATLSRSVEAVACFLPNANIMDLDAHIRLTLSVENAEILQNTIDNMNKVQGVAEIRRVIH